LPTIEEEKRMSAGNEESDDDEVETPDKLEEENFNYWAN
jgi:hypothetical protein